MTQSSQPAAHHCHARRCQTPVPPRIMMCDRHWRMVPSDLQDRIYKAYRPGQERDKEPSMHYIDLAFEAIDHVDDAESATL